MDGLTRTQPSQEPIQVEHEPTSQPVVEYEGVPLSIAQYFDFDPRGADHKEKEKINELFGMIEGDKLTEPEVMYRLQRLEQKIGQPSVGERRYMRMWSYVKTLKRVQSDIKYIFGR